MTVIDTVKSPPLDAMRAAGVTGVIRYVSLDQADTVWKRVTAAEYRALIAAGFSVLLNFEYAATDWLGGAAAGQAHAAAAVSEAKAVGYPAGCAIPGSADFNMTRAQWDTSCASYARAYSQGIRAGGYVAGVYGPWDVLGWCRDLGGFGVYWQAGMSTAWSAGRNAQPWPGAHLRQRGHLNIAGQDCDYNDVLQSNYGQAGGDMDPDLAAALRTLLLDNSVGGVSPAGWLPIKVEKEIQPALAVLAQKLDALAAPVPVALTPEQLHGIADLVVENLLDRLGAAAAALRG